MLEGALEGALGYISGYTRVGNGCARGYFSGYARVH